MSNVSLTEGALETIMKGGNVTDPIMQILGMKKIASGGGNPEKERTRLLLSDGKHSISYAMLTTQVNESLPNFSVIKAKRYITSIINNVNTAKGDARVLLIMEIEKLVDGDIIGDKIGNPVTLPDRSVTVPKPSVSNGTSNSNNYSNVVKSESSYSNGTSNLNNTTLNTQLTQPISSLSPYHNKWVIKARVSNKSQIRTWSNSKGEGKLFSFDLIDESGEIRCTAFRDHVDKFFDIIQVDKVFYISKCQLKPANKQFTTIKHDYEMTITSETIIEECHNENTDSIPKTKYDFVPIDKIAHMEVNTIVDVVGVAKNTGDLQMFTARSSGRELKKREVTLVDKSNTAIALTLWGSEAEAFDGTNNPVVVIKAAKVGEFGGGKNISTVQSSQLKCNPELDECYELRGWYDREGSTMEATNVSARTGAGGGFAAPWMSFKEAQDAGLGSGERGDYYQVAGTILLIRGDNAVYKACPKEDCNKKVIDMENGLYRCEKCNQEFPNFKYRLLASMNVGDYSGNMWVSMFSSEVEKILGMTSEEVGRAIESDPGAINQIMDKANFKQYVLKCRAKMETYNDETRLKTVAVKLDPINYEEYNAHLISNIEQLMGSSSSS